MKLIALYGSANSGKSALLKEVIKHFKSDLEINTAIDIQEIFEYKNCRIGIVTGGDDQDYIEKHLRDFANKKCNFLVTACRTKGQTHTAIYNICDEFGIKNDNGDYDIEWILKSRLDNKISIKDTCSKINQIEADCVIQFLKDLISKE